MPDDDRPAIEIVLHSTSEMSGRDLTRIASAARILGARVLVDTGGVGKWALKELAATGADVRPLAKAPVNPRVYTAPAQLTQLGDIVGRIERIEERIDSATVAAKRLHAEKDERINGIARHLPALNRKVDDLELQRRNQNATVATLVHRIEELRILCDVRARVPANLTPERANAVDSYVSAHAVEMVRQMAQERYVHGSGCHSQGMDVTKACPECEPVKGEPTRDDETSAVIPASAYTVDNIMACLPHLKPCQRTYPLDPLTAEDPCEDCGRDERKHEISPFKASDE